MLLLFASLNGYLHFVCDVGVQVAEASRAREAHDSQIESYRNLVVRLFDVCASLAFHEMVSDISSHL